MSNPPSLLNRQPQHIKVEIATMAKTQHYAVIVKWLNDHEVDANYNQLQHYIQSNNIITRLQPISSVKSYKAKVQIYIGALLEYDDLTFTINDLRLHGPSWSQVSVALHRAGMIESTRKYSPVRWRILATKDDLREWMKKEVQ